MAISKAIALSDKLYLRWIRHHDAFPETVFNQVCREALEQYFDRIESERNEITSGLRVSQR